MSRAQISVPQDFLFLFFLTDSSVTIVAFLLVCWFFPTVQKYACYLGEHEWLFLSKTSKNICFMTTWPLANSYFLFNPRKQDKLTYIDYIFSLNSAQIETFDWTGFVGPSEKQFPNLYPMLPFRPFPLPMCSLRQKLYNFYDYFNHWCLVWMRRHPFI